MPSRDYFKGKRIAVIGLGPHGEMVADVKHMIKGGALVSLYDLRSEARLKNELLLLRTVGLANYVCGSIPADDLMDMDIILLSHEYPRDSRFLQAIASAAIPVEYPETLFFKLAPPVTLVGVMGAYGKSTVMSMLTPLLEAACDAHGDQGFFAIDPESPDGVLAHLKKMKSGDIVLLRLSDAMIDELHSMRISPYVAIFASVPGSAAGAQSPFDILEYQNHNNFIIASDAIIDSTYTHRVQPKAKMLRTKASLIPSDWPLAIETAHDRDNAALALQAARLFKVSDDTARTVFSSWSPLKGRLEQVKKVKGVEFYNDTASVSPASTETALRSLCQGRNAVLIYGGAGTAVNASALYGLLPQCIHTMVLLPGSGTLRERRVIGAIEGIDVISAPSVEEAVRTAFERAKKGERVIFSPGFEAGGLDRSRKERGERFVRAVRSL